jgi:integrase
VALSLYRRHRRQCTARHSHNSFSTEFEERKRGWKRCECPIVVAGTLQKKFKRHSTNLWEWDQVRPIAAAFEQAGSWDAAALATVSAAQPSLPSPGGAAQTKRVTINDATEAYRAKCKGRNIQPTTYAKYKTFTNQVEAFATDRGYIFLDQLSVADMDRFYASWADGIRAKAKKLDRLKAFVKFCLKREWITKDITSDLEVPQGSSVPLPKAPFTDEELDDIFKACDELGPAPGPPRRNWSGEDAKDFIYLSIYTGMRISDVATFDITKRLNGNDVFLRMHKTRQPLHTWIPDWLVNRLRAREKIHGPLIFRCGVSLTMKQLTDIWRNRRLSVVFDLAGPFEEKPTPHRLRHTFVRILLEKGVPDTEVATLIGDTVEILRRHYARWIPGRQERLSRILKDAFEGKAKPHLVTSQK